MSPEPYVRGQALAATALFIVAAVLGSPLATLVLASVGAAIAFGLRSKYVSDVRVARVDVVPHRERLDRIVAGDAQTTFAVGLTASALLTAFAVKAPQIGLAPATPVLAALAFAGVYLSSLTDWYVILPRISGMLGMRPCRPEGGKHPSFPKTWRETTRWWYIHRILGALSFRFGLAFALSLTVKKYLPLPGEATVVTGAVLGAFTAYMASVPRAVLEAAHTKVVVGRTIRRRETGRVPLTLFSWGQRTFNVPGLKRVRVGPAGPREYVFDVALEGFEVVLAKPRERAVPLTDDEEIIYERHPLRLSLKDVPSCEPAESRFTGCDGRCSGISWYCIENPQCFELK